MLENVRTVNENLNNSKIAKEEAEKLRADYEAQLRPLNKARDYHLLTAGEESKTEIIDMARNEAAEISKSKEETSGKHWQ